MVLVSSVALPGTTTQIGGVTPAQLAYVQSTVASQQNGFVVGNGANGGTPAAPSVGIPNNFWGFVMLTMGLR
jgi:hypothetical protein